MPDDIELEQAIDKAGLNAAHRGDFVLSTGGKIEYTLSGIYSIPELESLLSDMKRVQAALTRIAR